MIFQEDYTNQIICGDCIDVMEEIPNRVIDLTVTSPPYDNLRKYGGFHFNFTQVVDELYRITKKGGVVIWIIGDQTIKGNETGSSFRQALYFKDIGFNLYDTMIYYKKNPIPLSHRRYEPCFEYMFVFSKGKPKTFNPIMIKTKNRGRREFCKNRKAKGEINYAVRNRDGIIVIKKYKQKKNVWCYSVGSKRKVSHPAPFPSKLANDHIRSWSNEGDLVLDPLCGSGTTCVEAKSLNRNFIGIEISGEYCLEAEKEIKEMENA